MILREEKALTGCISIVSELEDIFQAHDTCYACTDTPLAVISQPKKKNWTYNDPILNITIKFIRFPTFMFNDRTNGIGRASTKKS